MAKRKKTDLDVVKKAESEPVKDRISDFKVHTTKPIIEPKNKGKKVKEKIRNGTKKAGKKRREKAGIKKPGANDKGDKGREPGKGDKTELPRVIEKRGERSGLDKILEKILPPWF